MEEEYMGMSASAHLLYGYYLGCPEETGWDVTQVHEDDDWGWNPEWFEEGSYGGVQDLITVRLLRELGVPAEEIEDLYCYKRVARLKELSGLEVVITGHLEWPHYVLAYGQKFHADQGKDVTVTEAGVSEIGAAKLRWAMKVLGLTPPPDKQHPRWILMSHYG